ncbi:MAG TPA: hypothetical protein VM012_14390 [Flavitalea sp.]|nr:hypothetical protein [Flavitalea sp.]
MKHVYCISGLGADERIFAGVSVAGAQLHFINWMQPREKEDIHSYASRLCGQITTQNPVLLGVSFGGMMAIEMAKQIPCSKVVLISSVKTKDEVPTWMKSCGRYRLDNILPSQSLSSYRILKLIRPLQNYFLGVTSSEEKKIANEYRDNVDPVYLKWAINQVLNWKNEWVPPDVVHLHGEKDHIFPIKKIKSPQVIRSGGHFMIMNRHEQISELLARALTESSG